MEPIKFKLKGKTYTVLEELENKEPSMIKFVYKVENSKKEEFVLIKSSTRYTLYKGNQVILKTYSIKGLN